MTPDHSLRRLLEELQAADAERQGEARDSPAYTEAQRRVDRLMKDVWREADSTPVSAPNQGPEASTDL